MFSFKNFVPVKNRVRVRVRVKGLGLGFRDRVRIHNIIGGAAGAHISMTSYTFTHVWLAVRKTPVPARPQDRKYTFVHVVSNLGQKITDQAVFTGLLGTHCGVLDQYRTVDVSIVRLNVV